MKKNKYRVLRDAVTTCEVVVYAHSPDEAVANAYKKPLAEWTEIGGNGYLAIDTVTEAKKDGKAYSVEGHPGVCTIVPDE